MGDKTATWDSSCPHPFHTHQRSYAGPIILNRTQQIKDSPHRHNLQFRFQSLRTTVQRQPNTQQFKQQIGVLFAVLSKPQVFGIFLLRISWCLLPISPTIWHLQQGKLFLHMGMRKFGFYTWHLELLSTNSNLPCDLLPLTTCHWNFLWDHLSFSYLYES